MISFIRKASIMCQFETRTMLQNIKSLQCTIRRILSYDRLKQKGSFTIFENFENDLLNQNTKNHL